MRRERYGRRAVGRGEEINCFQLASKGSQYFSILLEDYDKCVYVTCWKSAL